MKRLIATLGKDSSTSLSEKTMTILNAPNGSGFKILLSDNIAHYFVRQTANTLQIKPSPFTKLDLDWSLCFSFL